LGHTSERRLRQDVQSKYGFVVNGGFRTFTLFAACQH
jgi:hypothetical protein